MINKLYKLQVKQQYSFFNVDRVLYLIVFILYFTSFDNQKPNQENMVCSMVIQV